MGEIKRTLAEMDLITLRDAIAGGDLGIAEVAASFIEVVAERNPQLNAIVRFDEHWVQAQVRELEQRRRAGETLPLLGVPFTVKDTLWIKGRTATQGSRLFADFVAPEDAVAVQRLKQAGALILGHSNSSEFACKGVTTNRLYGATRNPWNLEMTPGGSSGGAAAAVSAGLGAFALCTDGGGSTRRPAAHSGVVGLKPSCGLIPHPTGFQEPLFGNGVIGLMTRRIADLEPLLATLAGAHPCDADTPVGLARESDPIASVAGARIAFSPRFGLDVPVEEDQLEAIAGVASALEHAGAIVEPRDPVWPQGAGEAAFATLQFAGLAALYGDAFQRDAGPFDPDIAAQIEKGLGLSGADVARAYFDRAELYRAMADLFSHCDAVLTPTTPCTAWPHSELGPATIAGQPVSPRGHAVFTPIINHSFHAAVSVPCGIASNGLPMGAQIIVPRFRDARALKIGRVVEETFGAPFARPRWPLT
ncbi:amidotransferase [Marinobacterium nitratireducens]|uniref:Amidotransferase n=1 Tax=Marinobacterium nitratireducens TaxID=518897 RepID=A0A917ZNZ6_9GAMM|nr:amidase [Marinobacterium nitratireducens]GGO86145.1 amidotransferase [Marinobacterium nitratireducens]